MNSAFANELTGTSCWSPPVKLRAFGHTHHNSNFVRDGVKGTDKGVRVLILKKLSCYSVVTSL